MRGQTLAFFEQFAEGHIDHHHHQTVIAFVSIDFPAISSRPLKHLTVWTGHDREGGEGDHEAPQPTSGTVMVMGMVMGMGGGDGQGDGTCVSMSTTTTVCGRSLKL